MAECTSSLVSWFESVAGQLHAVVDKDSRAQLSLELRERWKAALSLNGHEILTGLPIALKEAQDDSKLVCTVLFYHAVTTSPDPVVIQYLVRSGADIEGMSGTCFYLWQLCYLHPAVPWCSQRTTPFQLATLFMNEPGREALLSLGATPLGLFGAKSISWQTSGDKDVSRAESDRAQVVQLLTQGWLGKLDSGFLYSAAASGYGGTLQLLYYYGAPVDTLIAWKYTPLSATVDFGHYQLAQFIVNITPSFASWQPAAVCNVLSCCIRAWAEKHVVLDDLMCNILCRTPKRVLQDIEHAEVEHIAATMRRALEHADATVSGKLTGLWKALLLLSELSPSGRADFLFVAIKLKCAAAVLLYFERGNNVKDLPLKEREFRCPASGRTVHMTHPIEMAAEQLGEEVKKLVKAQSNTAAVQLLRIIRILSDNGAALGNVLLSLHKGASSRTGKLLADPRHVHQYEVYLDVAMRRAVWTPAIHHRFPPKLKVAVGCLLTMYHVGAKRLAKDPNARVPALCHQPLDTLTYLFQTMAAEFFDWF